MCTATAEMLVQSSILAPAPICRPSPLCFAAARAQLYSSALCTGSFEASEAWPIWLLRLSMASGKPQSPSYVAVMTQICACAPAPVANDAAAAAAP